MESTDSSLQEVKVFDWEKCAELHNQILDIGWAAPALREAAQLRNLDSWWQHYFGEVASRNNENGNQAEEESNQQGDPAIALELEQRLSPSVVKFLQKARYHCPGWHPQPSFFYYFGSLVSPKNIIQSLNDELGPVAPGFQTDRYVWLYFLNGWGGMGIG
jgi:hypothetical protein